MHFSILPILSLASIALASPVKQPELAERDVCKAVDFVVALLKLNHAGPFCSSYLSIKPATSTSTILTNVTSTSLVSAQLATTTVTASTTTVTAVTGVSKTTCSAVANNQRRAQKSGTPAVPIYLAAFAKNAISTACSCLAIPASTSTAVATKAVTVVVTSTVSLTGTITTTPTATVSTGITSTVTPLINLPYGSGAGTCSDEDNWFYYNQAIGQMYAHNCMYGNLGPGYKLSNFDNSWTFATCVDQCVSALSSNCVGIQFMPSQYCSVASTITSGGYAGGAMVGYKTSAPPCVNAAASKLSTTSTTSTTGPGATVTITIS
jgi:hypothetical protein